MNNDQRRPRPHVAIPAGAQRPINPSPSFSPYSFEVTPPPYPNNDQELDNPWDAWDMEPASPVTAHERALSIVDLPHRLRTGSVFETGSGLMTFPEPQLFRSSSSRSALRPEPPRHRHSKSDTGPATLRSLKDLSSYSVASAASSYYNVDDEVHSQESDEPGTGYDSDTFSQELSNLSLDSEEGLRRFQNGELSEKDEEWYRLVPPEAREALGKQEVQRQSVLFEVFKGERDYVSDLEAVREVFIEPLLKADPPIIPRKSIQGFIAEVFGNLSQLLQHHQRMLAALFARQRDQHPLVQSVADIILDCVLKADFRDAYETYIKHYPLSESYHRKELKRNQDYKAFIQSASSDPRIRKRDLVTFLSRPVTRLPRLNLVLEQILKLTDKEYEHPDLETLPLILSILSDFLKSTQPGIEAAENKVKFWALSESLVFQKGEIIDMDLYDESRSLIYAGPLARRQRESEWSSFTDLHVALLDNYLVLTREETRSKGTIKRVLISRPLPLSYLRLAAFNTPPESRKSRTEEGGIIESLRSHSVPVYPFTIYHASNKSDRRYTLYASSEALRHKWHTALVDAMGLHRARQDANMWFDAQTISDGFFRAMNPRVVYSASTRFTGKVTSAVPFVSSGRKFLAVGCANGIYVALRGESSFRKILSYASPNSMAVLQTHENKIFNKFLVHTDTVLLAYSLDILARVATGQAKPEALDASMEKIAGQDANVLFFRVAHVGKRVLVVYASKRTLQVTLNLNVLEAVDITEASLTPKRSGVIPRSFRPFGQPGYVPKDAFDVTPLAKTIAISTSGGIVIADPTNLARSDITVVPDLTDASTNLPMSTLKSRISDAKPLGLVRCEASEILVIYDTLGCYVTKHGIPARSSGYIKWESKATSYAHRGVNVLLFSPHFIEIRNVNTGRLVQVIETREARLLHCGPARGTDDIILAAMRGGKDDTEGISDKIVDLVETSAITSATLTTARAAPTLWDEWDM